MLRVARRRHNAGILRAHATGRYEDISSPLAAYADAQFLVVILHRSANMLPRVVRRWLADVAGKGGAEGAGGAVADALGDGSDAKRKGVGDNSSFSESFLQWCQRTAISLARPNNISGADHGVPGRRPARHETATQPLIQGIAEQSGDSPRQQ